MIGSKIGMWMVIEEVGRDKWNKIRYRCLCDCGNEKIVVRGNLVTGDSTNCGCIRSKKISDRNYKHGLSGTYEYGVWAAMKTRATNPNIKQAKDYSLRGIVVCEEWSNSFEKFLEDMGKAPSHRHTIERKNNEEGYRPDNCRWATYVEQNNNRRNNVRVVMGGENKTLAQWCRDLKVSPSTVYYRIRKGMNLIEALTTKGGECG